MNMKQPASRAILVGRSTIGPRDPCVALGAFARGLNDAFGGDAHNARRSEALREFITMLAVAEVSPEITRLRGLRCLDWLVRHWLPTWLDVVPALSAHAAALRELERRMTEAIRLLRDGVTRSAPNASAIFAPFVPMLDHDKSPTIDLTPTDRARALTFDDTRLVAARELVDRYESCLRRGVPERQLLAVLHSQVAPNEAWKAAGRWRTGRGLYALSGPIGTGKTVAAARWAAFAGAAWVPACDAVVHTAQESLGRAPALVIDELGGHGSSSPLAVERIGATLSRRHAERKPTLFTTNLNRDDFGRLFDGDAGASRILDRIDEDGEWVVCLTRMRQRMEPTAERIDAARELLRLWPIVLDTRDDDGGTTARSMDRLQAMLELDEDELHRRAADARASQARIGDLVASLYSRMWAERQGGGA